jgi:hypothetical protein
MIGSNDGGYGIPRKPVAAFKTDGRFFKPVAAFWPGGPARN